MINPFIRHPFPFGPIAIIGPGRYDDSVPERVRFYGGVVGPTCNPFVRFTSLFTVFPAKEEILMLKGSLRVSDIVINKDGIRDGHRILCINNDVPLTLFRFEELLNPAELVERRLGS